MGNVSPCQRNYKEDIHNHLIMDIPGGTEQPTQATRLRGGRELWSTRQREEQLLAAGDDHPHRHIVM